MALPWTPVEPVANRTNVTLLTSTAAVPSGLGKLLIRGDLANNNDFIDPAQILLLMVQCSFDGGNNFQDVGGGILNGSPTSTWGKGSPNPIAAVGVPQGQPFDGFPGYPTHVRGRIEQTGSFHFGISIEAT